MLEIKYKQHLNSGINKLFVTYSSRLKRKPITNKSKKTAFIYVKIEKF